MLKSFMNQKLDSVLNAFHHSPSCGKEDELVRWAAVTASAYLVRFEGLHHVEDEPHSGRGEDKGEGGDVHLN